MAYISMFLFLIFMILNYVNQIMHNKASSSKLDLIHKLLESQTTVENMSDDEKIKYLSR